MHTPKNFEAKNAITSLTAMCVQLESRPKSEIHVYVRFFQNYFPKTSAIVVPSTSERVFRDEEGGGDTRRECQPKTRKKGPHYILGMPSQRSSSAIVARSASTQCDGIHTTRCKCTPLLRNVCRAIHEIHRLRAIDPPILKKSYGGSGGGGCISRK